MTHVRHEADYVTDINLHLDIWLFLNGLTLHLHKLHCNTIHVVNSYVIKWYLMIYYDIPSAT
jgi:hypothetical protein